MGEKCLLIPILLPVAFTSKQLEMYCSLLYTLLWIMAFDHHHHPYPHITDE